MDSVLIAALQVLCEEEKSNQVAFFFLKMDYFCMKWEGKPGTNQKDNTRYDLFPECN